MTQQDEIESQQAAGGVRRGLSDVPCFRQTFLYGIGSGLTAGLATFMMTSRPRTASHVSYGTFFSVTLAYWCYCRYTWATANFQYRQLQHAMRHQVLDDGTEVEVAVVTRLPRDGEPATSPEISRA